MPHDPYVYPGTEVLQNVWDVRDQDELDRLEAEVTALAVGELSRKPFPGNYDLQHLQDFHRHIFGDVYPWAGEIRTAQITKGGDLFAMPQHIDSYLSTVLANLPHENYLRGLDHDRFVDRLADYYAEINATHPFREGNGRTQRAFLSQLAEQAGYHIRWNDLDAQRNNDASRQANRGDTGPLRELLDDITVARDRSQERTAGPTPKDAFPRDVRERDDDDDDRSR